MAIGVRATGEREILGFTLGASEEYAFPGLTAARTGWMVFLRSLKRRGLQGVELVISDAHEGLKAAIHKVFTGATWKRCRVHFTLAPAV